MSLFSAYNSMDTFIFFKNGDSALADQHICLLSTSQSQASSSELPCNVRQEDKLITVYVILDKNDDLGNKIWSFFIILYFNIFWFCSSDIYHK